MPSKDINKEDLSDLDLIHRYRNSHDMSYVGRLYMKYSHLVYGVCLKYFKDSEEAKDASMAIFEELVVQLKKHEIQHFPAWLHMVCKNHCLMKLRKKSGELKKQQNYYNSTAGDVESEDWLHLESKESKEKVLNRMEHLIDYLKEEQKICLRMFYLEELSYKEVSDRTGYSLNEVKSYIQNGKRNLKILLEQENA